MFQFSFIHEENWEGQAAGHFPEIDPDLFWAAAEKALRGETWQKTPEGLEWHRPCYTVHMEVTDKGRGVLLGLDAILVKIAPFSHGIDTDWADFEAILTRFQQLSDALERLLYSHELDRFVTLTDAPLIYASTAPSLASEGLGDVLKTQFSTIRYKRAKLLWLGLCFALLLALKLYPETRSQPASQQMAALPSATISVDEGYTISRSEVIGNARNLGWVIQENGVTVLERNAEQQMKYRYYALKQGFTYAVYLQAWDGKAYVPISNKVNFTVR